MNLSEKEALVDLFSTDTWGVLLDQVEAAAQKIDSRVLSYNLAGPLGAQGLLIEKARSEGARQLQIAIMNFKKEMKKSTKQ